MTFKTKILLTLKGRENMESCVINQLRGSVGAASTQRHVLAKNVLYSFKVSSSAVRIQLPHDLLCHFTHI